MLQLPSVVIDAVEEDSLAVTVANRNPQPGEVQIPTSTAIEFDLFGQPPSSLTIRVNDAVVVSAGTAVGAWLLSSSSLPSAVGTHVRLTPPDSFANGELVRVRLEAGSELEFWSFTTYDVQPPLIRAVLPVNKDQLRVTFSEPVYMGSTEAGDALNPQSYWIERVSRPATTPLVVHVDQLSSTEVLLTTDFELSFGAKYMLVVTGVSDEFGNVFAAPNNVGEFNAFLPPFPKGRRWLLHDFVPRFSLSEDTTGDLRLFLACLQDTNNILLHSIDKWIELIDPDTAPPSFLNAMLVDLGNPFSFELTEAQKRRLIKSLVIVYRLKGTAKGIIDVVRFFLGIECTIETFVGRGWRVGIHQLSNLHPFTMAANPAIIGPNRRALYSFRVHTTVVLSATQRADIREIALYMKGAQEHLAGIVDGSPVPPAPYWWTIGVTRSSRTHVFHEVAPVTNVEITSFVLSPDAFA